MGDISTHAEIAWKIGAKLTPKYPAWYFMFLDLGSFLTDISQFNDPFAFQSKRWFLEQDSADPLTRHFRDAFVDDLLGTTGRPGAMATYFQFVARAAARLVFCDLGSFARALSDKLANDAKRHPDAAMNAMRGASEGLARTLQRSGRDKPSPGASELSDLKRMANALEDLVLSHEDLEKIFERRYTQYFPHEHMDMPPWNPPPRDDKREFGEAMNGLIQYIEDYKDYLVESLAEVERQMIVWQNLETLEGKLLLVQLGHLLHAIEDFYFHSNFAELQHRFARGAPMRDPTDERKRLRRLRFPAFEASTLADAEAVSGRNETDYHPSVHTSVDRGNVLFTGFFGGQELGHSIEDALHGLMGFLTKLLGRDIGLGGSSKYPVLLRLVADPSYRAWAATGSDVLVLRTHRQEMLGPKGEFTGSRWDGQLTRWLQERLLSAPMEADLRSAFLVDVALLRKHSTAAGKDMKVGIGAAMIKIIVDAEREAQRSDRVSAILGHEGIDAPTYNGASSETIGTHTLLSKDSARKGPFREETFALAFEASCQIASRMLGQLASSAGDRLVNWRVLTDEYLRVPVRDPDAWENVVVSKATGLVASSPNAERFWTDLEGQKRWGVGGSRAQLEKLYTDLEGPAAEGRLPRWLTPASRTTRDSGIVSNATKPKQPVIPSIVPIQEIR